MSDWLLLPAIFALLAASAFFSGSESAFTAANRPRLSWQREEKRPGAGRALRLLDDRDRLIGAILIGNNLANSLATSLAAGFLVVRFGDEGVLYATVAMTVLISFFGEVLPKFYALQDPERNARRAAWPLSLLAAAARPAVAVIYALAERLLGAERKRAAAQAAAAGEEALRGAIEGHGRREEREMLRSILALGETALSEVMRHRSEVRSLPAEMAGQALLQAALAIPHSRIPVWQGRPDNVVGILYVKDLFRNGGAAGKDAAALARKPWFVPESTGLAAQLRAFRDRGEHIAVVVDEYGEMMGLVALEDILEEIVGEIFDEEDARGSDFQAGPDGAVTAAGNAALRDLNRRFGWRLPDEEASTVAGLVLYEAKRIPEAGEVIRADGWSFRILERSGRGVKRVEILPPEGEAAGGQEDGGGSEKGRGV